MDGYYDFIIVEQPTIVANTSDDPCSHNFDCTLSFKTRSRIGSALDDNGISFSDCQSRCTSEFDNTQGSTKKSKINVNAEECDCYCAMFHDPCPDAPSTGIHIVNPSLSNIIVLAYTY